MERPGPAPAEAEYEPDFVLSRYDAINEGNWPEYQRQGFVVVEPYVANEELDRRLKWHQTSLGVANVYTGEPFDPEAGRPAPNPEGRGIYAHPNGDAYSRRLAPKMIDGPPALMPPTTPEAD